MIRNILLVILTSFAIAGTASAANDRAIRSLAHSNYLIRQQQAWRAYRQNNPQIYRGTAPFAVDPVNGNRRSFGLVQSLRRRELLDWKQNRDGKYAKALGGE